MTLLYRIGHSTTNPSDQLVYNNKLSPLLNKSNNISDYYLGKPFTTVGDFEINSFIHSTAGGFCTITKTPGSTLLLAGGPGSADDGVGSVYTTHTLSQLAGSNILNYDSLYGGTLEFDISHTTNSNGVTIYLYWNPTGYAEHSGYTGGDNIHNFGNNPSGKINISVPNGFLDATNWFGFSCNTNSDKSADFHIYINQITLITSNGIRIPLLSDITTYSDSNSQGDDGNGWADIANTGEISTTL